MNYLLLFISEILLMFFLSIRLQTLLGNLLMKITRNPALSIYIAAFIYLPGTLIHELAHFLTALILLVPATGFRIWPKIEGDRIILGSVKVARTDPVRSFLISFAPVIYGLAAILSITGYLAYHTSGLNWIYLVIAGYFVFAVSNTMFMSKKDTGGIWGFIVMMALLVFLGFIMDVNIYNYLREFAGYTEKSVMTAVELILVPVVIDIAAIIILSIF